MTKSALKKELHQAIDDMPDAGFLQAIYRPFKEYALGIEQDCQLTVLEKAELLEPERLHLSGTTKSYTVSHPGKRILSGYKKEEKE